MNEDDFNSDNFELEILFQNENFIVVNKPSGIIVHPWKECADNFSVLKILKRQTGKWIFPIHRLDRPVSGPLVFAFSSEWAKKISFALQEEKTLKVYLGLCKGQVKEKKSINYPLWNQAKTVKQSAETNFWPLSSNEWVSLVKFRIHTGRYHQIRRHCSAMAHQLIGDSKYGKGRYNRYYREEFQLNRLFLHCCYLSFELNNDLHEFFVPLPKELRIVIDKLNFPNPSKSLIIKDLDKVQTTVNKIDIVESIAKIQF